VADTEALTPMASLAGRWGIKPNTVSRRLAFLGIKPIRQGNFRFLTPEQMELAERLHQHILPGNPMDTFPRPDADGQTGLVARQAPRSGLVARPVPEPLTLQLAADPLARARGLAEAADRGLVLTSAELEALGVKGITGWREDTDRLGYRFRRHKQGATVLWTVERALGAPAALPPATTSPATSRAVGFHAAVIDASYRVVEGPSLFPLPRC